MCYSARVWASYRSYAKAYGARIDIDEYIRLLELRRQGAKILIPGAMTDVFKRDAQTSEERHCRDLVDQFEAVEVGRIQAELFEQRHRLADAERALLSKTTKKALESKRIATAKVERLLDRLADFKRLPGEQDEARIFPGVYCPVMLMDGSGDYVVKPMRYQCRPAGKPAFFDSKYPGTYNARRDSLDGYWRGQFGVTHAVVVASAFFENVSRHRLEGRDLAPGEEPENLVLRFSPADGLPMQVACLWSHWQGQGQDDLLSFAAITDEPPAEVSAAGHDRCIIPLKTENLARWLAPTASTLADHLALLDDRHRPYYTHLLAA